MDDINVWTQEQKMKINQSKTKTMKINFTNKYQFNTRLKVNNDIIQTVEETKQLGTILTNDLKWDKNTNNIVKKILCRIITVKETILVQSPNR